MAEMLHPAPDCLVDRTCGKAHRAAVKSGARLKGVRWYLNCAGSESEQDIVLEVRDADVLLALDQFENGAAGLAEKSQVAVAGSGQPGLNGEDKPLRQERFVGLVQVHIDEKGDMLQPQVGFTRLAA